MQDNKAKKQLRYIYIWPNLAVDIALNTNFSRVRKGKNAENV